MNATRRDLFDTVHQWIARCPVVRPCFCCFALHFCHRPSVNCLISCRTLLFLLFCAALLSPSISELPDFLSDAALCWWCRKRKTTGILRWAVLRQCYDKDAAKNLVSKDYPEIYKEVKDCQSVISQRSNNTLVGFMKRLKVCFSWCIEEGLISESPLAGFEMPTEKYGTPIYK